MIYIVNAFEIKNSPIFQPIFEELVAMQTTFACSTQSQQVQSCFVVYSSERYCARFGNEWKHLPKGLRERKCLQPGDSPKLLNGFLSIRFLPTYTLIFQYKLNYANTPNELLIYVIIEAFINFCRSASSSVGAVTPCHVSGTIPMVETASLLDPSLTCRMRTCMTSCVLVLISVHTQ